MNQEELEQEIRECYQEFLTQKQVLAEQERKVQELDDNLKDLNTALRVVRDLRNQKNNVHHKD
jgi:hypothetical protein